MTDFAQALAQSRIVAILRNLSTDKALAVGEALIGAGVTLLEVPLNGREAWETFGALAKAFSSKAAIGVGTVLSPQDVGRVSARGGNFIVSPNMDPEVVNVTKRLGLASIPGVATPTEAFAAIKAGAAALKLFPGQGFSSDIIKAWRTVLPPEIPLLLSGGVNASNIHGFVSAGVAGFMVSSAIFAPELDPDEIGEKAKALIEALKGGGKAHAHDGK
ncbi:MAG: 2-dehydro-3-deoxy-6-phosphogalactonate aldolase [Alphaproteobacteria bacterium]|nr:2-dehydro-3-deoxy-6-phosphogalactonate aldolase [Alphaproteobacteria bacterium]